MRTTPGEKAFDRGAWQLLAGVSIFVFLVLVNTITVLRLPGDGWQIDYNERNQGDHLLNYFMGEWATPLQVGDVVIALNGQPLPSAVQMTPLPPAADWVDGGTVQYTIQRQGETLDVPVTLHRLNPAGILRGLANTMTDELSQWSWFVAGLVVFFLRPGNRAARLLLLAATSVVIVTKFGWAATTISLDYAPPLTWLVNWVAGYFWGWLFFPSLILLLLAFPVPLWPLTRFPRLVPVLFYGIPLAITAYTLLTGQLGLGTALLFVEALLIVGTAVAAIVQVFRQKQNRVARAQVSWLALGITISMGGTLIAYLLEYTGVALPDDLLSTIVFSILTLALPFCLAIAILRYRLFDINIIIRKTLVYAVLTALLGLVYFGVIVVLQSIFEAVSGEQSAISIVVSTLVIAALFAPLRRRVQDFIDRRFYRRRYDAEKTLAAFGQFVRDETNMEALTAELLRVTEETMQPEKAAIWLNQPIDEFHDDTS